MDDLYRDNILDHYKNPRHHGELEHPTVSVEGQNPLCGDHLFLDLEVEDGKIKDIRFRGRGCAISQAATSMLTELVIGKPVGEVVEIGREEIVEELGIPLSPVRLKCALLGLGTLKVALHRAVGTPLPAEWAGMDEISWT